MKKGQFLCSTNKRFVFGIDVNGKFGLFEGGKEVWSVETSASGENLDALLRKRWQSGAEKCKQPGGVVN